MDCGLFKQICRGSLAKGIGEGVQADVSRWIKSGWLGLEGKERERGSTTGTVAIAAVPWPALVRVHQNGDSDPDCFNG